MLSDLLTSDQHRNVEQHLARLLSHGYGDLTLKVERGQLKLITLTLSYKLDPADPDGQDPRPPSPFPVSHHPIRPRKK